MNEYGKLGKLSPGLQYQMDRADKAESELAALNLAVTEDFEFLWRNYAMEDDAKLSEDAQRLKQWLLATFASREEAEKWRADALYQWERATKTEAELAAAKADAARWRKVAEEYYNLKHYSIDVTVTDNTELYVFDRNDVDACDEAYDAAAKEGDAK